MDSELLRLLSGITPEERAVLDGGGIDRSLYMHGDSAEIDARLLLERGKLITLRPHTRFVHFPQHTHNYVEMVYMCSGRTTHIVNGTTVELHAGELLLLNQSAVQEILPAGEEDVAVNFIILPPFFDSTLRMLGEEENPLRDFLVDCLRRGAEGTGYLHFRVSRVLPIQNLAENLIWTLTRPQSNRRSIAELTMGLLFLQLSEHTDELRTDPQFSRQQLALSVLRYVDAHYADGSLGELAQRLSYDPSFLCRAIHRSTGRTFTQLMQNRRMIQAAFLLRTTSMKVIEVAESIGYGNISYFHRIFRSHYGMSPHQYRKSR